MERPRVSPEPEDPAPVSRREVWYFHGFDPATTARYRRIFAAASERLGVQIHDRRDEVDGWVATRGRTQSRFGYARYEDLVRDFQYAPLWRRMLRGWGALAGYFRDGALSAMAARGPRNLMLALGPALVPFMVVVFSITFALGLALALSRTGGIAAQGGWVLIVAALLPGPLATLAIVPGLMLHLVADLFAYMRVLAKGASGDRSGHGAAHAARIADLSDQIVPAGDEVLVVGHSLGGVAAILAVDRVLDRWPLGREISLLTLGSVHGTVLVQRGAGRDRLAAAIRRIVADPRVFWVDVSAPRDSFCLPLVDPLLLAGGGPSTDGRRVISARLARAPRIPGDRRTVFAAMRRHMGYLLAPVDGSGFDYAETVTGPVTLRGRFAGRGNSPKAEMWAP